MSDITKTTHKTMIRCHHARDESYQALSLFCCTVCNKKLGMSLGMRLDRQLKLACGREDRANGKPAYTPRALTSRELLRNSLGTVHVLRKYTNCMTKLNCTDTPKLPKLNTCINVTSSFARFARSATSPSFVYRE